MGRIVVGTTWSLVLFAGLVMVAAAGCAVSFRLTIYNADRDPVRVVVNGRDIGRLTCADPPLILSASLLDPLPWQVEIVDEATGQRLGPQTINGTWPNEAMLIRDVGLIVVPPAEAVGAAAFGSPPECLSVMWQMLPQNPNPNDFRAP